MDNMFKKVMGALMAVALLVGGAGSTYVESTGGM